MLDNRFPAPGIDARFDTPGVDDRFPSPGVDTRFPEPGIDTRFTDVTPVTPTLSGDTWPEQPQSLPPNLIPQPAGEFDTAEGWNAISGLTIEDGRAKWDGSTTGTEVMQIDLVEPAVTGNQYGYLIGKAVHVSGNAIAGAQFPTNSADGSGANAVGHFSRQNVATGDHTQGRIVLSSGSNAEIDYLRMYDLSVLLQKKWRIVFVYSQSNWVAGSDAADKFEVDLPESRAVSIPSRAAGPLGSFLDDEGVGIPMLLCDPVAHLAGASNGGPAGAFGRTFCDGLRDDEVLVYVAAGYSGGGRTQPGDPWYHDETESGVAWTNLLHQVDTLLSRAPEGSSVAGCLFCQGEADIADITGDEHAIAIRSDFEFLRARWGNFPVVINEIGRVDVETPQMVNMLTSQAKLDSNSGDPLSLPLCRYVPRPEGSTFLEDGVHYDQATQRVRGSLAATALLELYYGPKP